MKKSFMLSIHLLNSSNKHFHAVMSEITLFLGVNLKHAREGTFKVP